MGIEATTAIVNQSISVLKNSADTTSENSRNISVKSSAAKGSKINKTLTADKDVIKFLKTSVSNMPNVVADNEDLSKNDEYKNYLTKEIELLKQDNIEQIGEALKVKVKESVESEKVAAELASAKRTEEAEEPTVRTRQKTVDLSPPDVLILNGEPPSHLDDIIAELRIPFPMPIPIPLKHDTKGRIIEEAPLIQLAR